MLKFTCKQESLEKGLNQVYKAVPTRASLPILSNVHLLAESGRLRLAGTNLDTSIVTYVGAVIDEEGAVAVPAKLFRDFVSNIPSDTVTVTTDDTYLYIDAGSVSTKFNIVPAKDYPNVPTLVSVENALELDTSLFVDALKLVAFSASTDDSRPVFMGVLLSFVDGLLSMVATDGFRLSEFSTALDTTFSQTFSAVVPAKTLLEVTRLVDTSEPTYLSLDVSSNLLLLKNMDVVVGTRLLEGQFPDYKKIIPIEHVLEVEMQKQDLLDAVRLADVFAQQVDSSLKLTFNSDENKVQVSAVSPGAGEHTSAFSASVEGEPLDITLNSKYLLDFLTHISSDALILRTQASMKPCVLIPTSRSDYLHLIMPRQSRD